ncbi:MAG: replication restart helicase PriA, partial [Thermoleophilaceae bacterium]
MIAKVEPLTSARALRGPFDYRLSGRLGDVGVGSMLVVPFGRQRMLGVVVGLAEESELPAERLVEPLTALDPEVPAELVKLGLWVAEEYCSTPARGLGLVLPPGTGRGERPRVKARRLLVAELTAAGKEALLAGGPKLGERQHSALCALRSGGALPAADLCRTAGCSHASLRGLAQRRLIILEQRELGRRPQLSRVGALSAAAPELSPAQQAALDRVVARMDAEEGGRLLLHGVTGSGKTEVYLRAVDAALERGRSAIVLVPEIALTPQTAGRFEQRFGHTVAVLHSKLGAGERYDEWARLRRGEARVCVGPRSAVFAPLTDLGLIVVDEEHDPSYKQESDPRYDARHVAERRAEQAGAVLLAGSATPRPESWLALERIELPERVDGRGLPPVEVVSMAGVRGALHERTREALEAVRLREEKAIVLLNRRGWSNFLSCRVCGRVWSCPQCDVTLVLHRAAAVIACHHCGHQEDAPSGCPDCGSVSVARH